MQNTILQSWPRPDDADFSVFPFLMVWHSPGIFYSLSTKYTNTSRKKNLFASCVLVAECQSLWKIRMELGYISLSRDTHSQFIKATGEKSRLRLLLIGFEFMILKNLWVTGHWSRPKFIPKQEANILNVFEIHCPYIFRLEYTLTPPPSNSRMN